MAARFFKTLPPCTEQQATTQYNTVLNATMRYNKSKKLLPSTTEVVLGPYPAGANCAVHYRTGQDRTVPKCAPHDGKLKRTN